MKNIKKLQIIYLSLLVACSSCASAPKISVYLSKPDAGGLFGSKNGEPLPFIKYEDTDKFVCTPPEDLQILLEYLKREASSAFSN